MQHDTTTITEKALAEELNVPRAAVAKLRAALPPDFVIIKKGAPITLTAEGAAAIRSAILPEKKDGAPDLAHLTPESPQSVALVVSRAQARMRNPRLLYARPEGAHDDPADIATLLTVRVRDNSKFLPGMPLARCTRQADGSFTYEGRLPRRRGHY